MEGLETISIVGSIVGEKNPPFRIQHHELGSGGAGIDAYENFVALHLVPAHTFHKEVLFFGFPFFKMLCISE